VAVCCYLGLAAPLHAAIVVGSFDVPRGGFDSLADAPEQADARAGIQLIRPDATFSSTNTLTGAYLSSVDVFILGGQTGINTAVSPLSAAEQSALVNFVLDGGNLAIFTENEEQDPINGAASRASFLSPFGLATSGLSLAPSATVVNPSHPIADGPFGTLTEIDTFRSGWYTDLGPYAHPIANENQFGMTMLATIEYGVMGPTSGRVAFIADSSVFDPGMASGPLLFANLTAYLVPEPGGVVLGAIGAACLAAFGIRRRSALTHRRPARS
jgi:hypothetical protein